MKAIALDWRDHQTLLLSSEVRAVLARFDSVSDMSGILEEALSGRCRVLNAQVALDTSMHLLPLVVCESVCGDFARALPVAAAIQFMLAAGDVFDDAEDRDSPESLSAKYGEGLALNAATTLMILAECSLGRLAKNNIKSRVCVKAFNILNDYYAMACAGQHADLKSSWRYQQTEAAYLRTVRQKSAAQFECACHLGAMVAGGTPKIQQGYRRFGRNLGMAAQLVNDISGITDRKDILAKKATLPIIYALSNCDTKSRQDFQRVWQSENGDEQTAKWMAKIILSTGAVYYTTLKLEYFRQQALGELSQIEQGWIDITRVQSIVTPSG